MTEAPPSGPSAILETALYVNDLVAAERFYEETLRLPVIAKVEGRNLAALNQLSKPQLEIFREGGGLAGATASIKVRL